MFACVLWGCGENGLARFLPEGPRTEHFPLVLVFVLTGEELCFVEWLQSTDRKGQMIFFLTLE